MSKISFSLYDMSIYVFDCKSVATTEINFTGRVKIISNFVEGIHKFNI